MSFLNTQEHATARGIPVISSQLHREDSLEEIYKQLLSRTDVQNIINRLESSGEFYSVDTQGKTSEEASGSNRITVHDKLLSQFLTKKIWEKLRLTPLVLNPYSHVDWGSDNPECLNYWIPLHVSPVFRYMRYKSDGTHDAHYDSEFKSPDNPLIRTLMSGVLYLSNNACYTRFINDNQDNIKHVDRDLTDWTRHVVDDDIQRRFPSSEGFCLVFPHGKCHDVSPNLSNIDRIVIRFDIFYQAIDKV